MIAPAPILTLQATADGRSAVLGGCWSAARLAEPANWARITQTLSDCAAGQADACHWDLTGLARLDHTGAQLLWNTWGRRFPSQLSLQPV